MNSPRRGALITRPRNIVPSGIESQPTRTDLESTGRHKQLLTNTPPVAALLQHEVTLIGRGHGRLSQGLPTVPTGEALEPGLGALQPSNVRDTTAPTEVSPSPAAVAARLHVTTVRRLTGSNGTSPGACTRGCWSVPTSACSSDFSCSARAVSSWC